MKVADVMSKQVEHVARHTSIKDVCRLIFGRGINGVPVLDKKKIVGFITERDVIAKFYPSIQEYIEDPVNMADFETMEEKASEVFKLPAEKIMSKDPITVSPETPLLRAESLMFVHKIGRLPVVDENGNLVGILSKGDIFKSIVGDRLSVFSDEEYHDWISRQYDLVIEWEERLSNEIPDMTSIFRKEKVKNILDVGCGTGEHDVSLVKKGFKVTGLERSFLMFNKAQEKKNKLPMSLKGNLEFIRGDYKDILSARQNEFDAAIFMGNALPHISDWKEVLKSVSKSLKKRSILVIQITNLEKIFKAGKRLQDFNIRISKKGQGSELAFVEFFDPPRRRGEPATFTMAILGFDGKMWAPRGINNTPVEVLDKDNTASHLKKLGFKKIFFYGSKYWGPIFKEKFDPLESDRLNIVVMR